MIGKNLKINKNIIFKTLIFFFLGSYKIYSLESSIKIDTRFESISDSENGETSFRIIPPRLFASAGKKDDFKFVFRIRLEEPQRENRTLDFLTVEKKLSNTLSITLGKQYLKFGGLEWAHNGYRVYRFSWARQTIRPFANGLKLTYNSPTLGYFDFQILDGTQYSEAFTGTNDKIYTSYWKRSFLNNSITPILSYSRAYFKENYHSDFYAAGLKLSHFGFDFEIDYQKVKNFYLASTDQSSGTISTKNGHSIFSLLKYKEGNINPFISVVSDKSTVDGKEESDITKTYYMGGIEYFHKSNKQVRYHIVYNHDKILVGFYSNIGIL